MNQEIDYVFSFAHRETGIFNGAILTASDQAAVALNTPADHMAVAGHHDYLCKRVDITTGAIVDWQPPQPSPDHEWHEPTKRWRLSEAAQAKAAAHAAARQRITALEAQSGPLVRKAALGDVNAIARLRSIDDEITQLLGPVELPQGARGPAPPGE